MAGDRISSITGRVAPGGQVNHTDTYRNPDTGVHSNDIESEFSRLKNFIKHKFTHVRASNHTDEASKRRLLVMHLMEYVFYTNVGSKMADIMLAIKHSQLPADV